MTRLFSHRPAWEMEKPSTFKPMPTRSEGGRVPAPPRPAWMSATSATSKRDAKFLELAARERDLTARARQARSPAEVERLDMAWRELRRDMQSAAGNLASGWRARQKDWEDGGRKANLKTVEKIRAREVEEQAVITRAAPASAGAVNVIQMPQRRSAPGSMTGHFSVFNTWYPCNDGGGVFMESVAPGSFSRTFARDRDGMRSLFNHGRDGAIGKKPLGTITDLREDDIGARYQVELLADTAYVRELLPGLRAGLYGSSFMFRAMAEDYQDRPKASVINPQGIPQRTITEAKVMEFGPVTFGANPAATAGVAT